MDTEVDMSGLVSVGFDSLLYLTLFIFILFSLALIYHWFSYSTDRKTSIGVMIVYLGVSAVIIMTAVIALFTIK